MDTQPGNEGNGGISLDGIQEIENIWIPMSDGCRIAARVWLPASAEAWG